MKVKYPFLFLDLDGTLLNSEKKINYTDYYALRLYASLGGRVVLASGRTPVSVRWISDCIGADTSFIAFNGAYTKVSDKETVSCCFEKSEIQFISRLVDKLKLESMYFTSNSLLLQEVTGLSRRWVNQIVSLNYLGSTPNQQDYEKDFSIITGEIHEEIKNVLKIVILPNDIVNFEAAYRSLKNQAFMLNMTPRYIEITKKGTNKSFGLRKITEYYHGTPQMALSIGDNENDFSIMRDSGFCVAVGNATKAIKELSNAIVATNNQNGVAEAILKYAIDMEVNND